MKKQLAGFAIVLISSLSGCEKPLTTLPKEALDSGSWQIGQITWPNSPGRIRIDRYRADLLKPIAILPYEATFTVRLKSPSPNGLFEDDAEFVQLETFENVLVREIQDSQEGSIFCVHTSDGTRRIVFYTQRNLAERSKEILDQCPAGYQYSFSSRWDPNWTDFFQTVERLKNAKRMSIEDVRKSKLKEKEETRGENK